MTERASDLLSKLAERLSADPGESGLVAAESVRSLAPEILKSQKGGSVDDLVKTSGKFLELLFRSLNVDSHIPWVEYYAIAREASRRYAEKGIPLEALMEGLSVFRRSVIARVTEEVAGGEGSEEVIRRARGRGGGVTDTLITSSTRACLIFTEDRHI